MKKKFTNKIVFSKLSKPTDMHGAWGLIGLLGVRGLKGTCLLLSHFFSCHIPTSLDTLPVSSYAPDALRLFLNGIKLKLIYFEHVQKEKEKRKDRTYNHMQTHRLI